MSRWIRLSAALCLSVALLLPCRAMAQQDSTVDWRLSLQELDRRLAGGSTDTVAVDAWRADAEALRSSIAFYATSHPDVKITLPASLADHPSAADVKTQLQALTAVVDSIIEQSPSSPFHLGTIEVNVSAPASTPSLVSDNIGQSEIAQHDFLNIAKAFDYLPGVEIQHIANNRNEAGMMVRGFTTRGQVPFLLDGIPISVPYDGYVDFNRFLATDLAELQVDKGYVSPHAGPNALGGTINLVTKEPTKALDGSATVGLGSGNTVLTSFGLGTRTRLFFLQGSYDRVRVDYLPLSSDFQVHQYTGLPDVVMSSHLNESATLDNRASARAGWTPKSGDEYVLTYTRQRGQKGVPLYQGPNTAATFRNFWQWPYWNMDSAYFHSSTRIGDSGQLRAQAFYNHFGNAIDMFSNDTYTVMNTSSAEHSVYNEHNDGASAQYETHVLSRQTISVSAFMKNDVHRENGVYPGRSPFPLNLPTLQDNDRQTSFGIQDQIILTPRLTFTAGFNADHFDGIEGQAYNSALTALLPFTCLASPANSAFSGCTLHAWNYNPQASVSYQVGSSGNLFATFADRGRFPMLKDIYSSGLGAGLPNPDLKPEHSRNWNVGYSQSLPHRTSAQFEWFRSDLRDAIESIFITDPGGSSAATAVCPGSKIIGYCAQNANIGNELHDGIEVKVRSTPISRLTVDASYSRLNRSINYDFANVANVSQTNSSIIILPTLPKNKVVGTAIVRLPYRVMGIVSARYESGLTLQDTSYATTSPLFAPFNESFATADLSGEFPIVKHATLQVGVKNLFDKSYFYTAGYPEIGRNWFANLRWIF